MSDAVGLKRSTTTWEMPSVKPLDEAVWEAWKAKGRARDRQARERRMKALTWGSIVALIVVAGLWSQLAPYEALVRFVLAAGATAMMFDAFNKRQYALGSFFAGLAVLYNPIAPLFTVSFNWQRGLVVASTVPFIISLAAREFKAAHLD